MVDLREILCGTDLEAPDHAALRYAFFVADKFACPLHVVHVWDTAEARPNSYVSAARRMERAVAAHWLRERLDVLVRAVPTGAMGRVRTHVEEGSLAQTLLECAKRQRADVIVLGASARGDRAGSTRGSLAGRLINASVCPILTVPDFDLAVAPRVKRLLLVIDSASTGSDVAEWFALIARRFDAVVHILYLETSRVGTRARTTRIHDIDETFRRAGVGVASTWAESGSGLGARVVLRAELEGCDMIAVNASLRVDGDPSVFEDVHSRSILPVFSMRGIAPDRLFVDSGFGAGMSQ